MGFLLLQPGRSFANHLVPLLKCVWTCSVVLHGKDNEAVYGQFASLFLICVLLPDSVCLLCYQLLAPGTRLGIYVNSACCTIEADALMNACFGIMSSLGCVSLCVHMK